MDKVPRIQKLPSKAEGPSMETKVFLAYSPSKVRKPKALKTKVHKGCGRGVPTLDKVPLICL